MFWAVISDVYTILFGVTLLLLFLWAGVAALRVLLILYHSLEELQADPDVWTEHYNSERTHQGKMCCGRTPVQTLLDGKKFWKEKVGQLN
jgi:hypothetical protein